MKKKTSLRIKAIIDTNTGLDDLTIELLMKAYNHNRILEEKPKEEVYIDISKERKIIYDNFRKGASVNTMARELKISPPTLYKIIDGKEVANKIKDLVIVNIYKIGE